MSDEQPRKEGAGRIVVLVVAFLTMPLPVSLMARAGYIGGRMEWTLMFMSPLIALFFAVGGVVTGCIQVTCALIARTSTRFVVRRLALFTLIVGTVGSMGSCVGGCVWGHKVSTKEWPEPRL
jgi:hypothetical protein